MSAFHLTCLGLTQDMNLNAFLRSSDAVQCQSVNGEHFLLFHYYGLLWPCCHWLFNNTFFPSNNKALTEYWIFFLCEANEIYCIFSLCCGSCTVNNQNPCLKISINWVYHDMEGDNLVFLIRTPDLETLPDPLILSGEQIHLNSSVLAWFLSKALLSHFTENTDHIWILPAIQWPCAKD